MREVERKILEDLENGVIGDYLKDFGIQSELKHELHPQFESEMNQEIEHLDKEWTEDNMYKNGSDTLSGVPGEIFSNSFTTSN